MKWQAGSVTQILDKKHCARITSAPRNLFNMQVHCDSWKKNLLGRFTALSEITQKAHFLVANLPFQFANYVTLFQLLLCKRQHADEYGCLSSLIGCGFLQSAAQYFLILLGMTHPQRTNEYQWPSEISHKIPGCYC